MAQRATCEAQRQKSVDVELSAKQSYVLETLERLDITEVLAGGGVYGGKSRVGCFWLLKCALMFPGTRWLMGRRELSRLKETTLVTFFEVAKEQGLLIGEDFNVNFQSNFILFTNGSKIILMDLAYLPRDPQFERLGSLELTGAFIDEAGEVTEKVKNILTVRVGRWRNKEYDYIGRVLMTCNPHKGWLYSTYYKPWKEKRLESYQTFIPMLAVDNPWLEPAYLQALLRLPENDKQRLYYGNWDYDADPARLMEYNKINDLWTNTHVESGERFLTCDIAMQGSDKFVILVWYGFRVISIHVEDKSDGKGIENKIKDLAEEHRIGRSNIIYDSDGIGAYLGSYVEGAMPFVNNGKPLERESDSQDGLTEIEENYANLKTQTSFELARMVQANEIYIVPKDYREEIKLELSWIKRDKVDKDGKLYLLPKDKVKEAIGHSPDFADALHMRMWFKLAREKITEVTSQATDDHIMENAQSYTNDDYGIADRY